VLKVKERDALILNIDIYKIDYLKIYNIRATISIINKAKATKVSF